MLETTLPQQTIRYLNQVFGNEAVRVAPSGMTAQLPYFLQDTYEVLPGKLLGQPITLACVKDRQPLAAEQLDQHAQRLRELLHTPVLIALPEITSGERKQLIAHGLAFVVPDRQLFAPQLGMILTERFGAEPRREQELASPATQALLIWFLNVCARQSHIESTSVIRHRPHEGDRGDYGSSVDSTAPQAA